jgi:hypothetical protein
MKMRILFRRYALLAGASGLALAGAGCSTATSESSESSAAITRDGDRGSLEIKTLSNRADLISGGDALVEIVLPRHSSPHRLRVRVGSRDVSSKFAVRAGGRIIGLVDGLAEGTNRVTAQADEDAASLTITNHKIGGSVISGPQVTPFACATPLAQPAQGNTPATNASGLSTFAIDDQCDIATEVKLFYRSTTAGCSMARPDPSAPGVPPANACFKPFDPAAAPPADLAMTTTDTGVTMPYVVRVERGTLNRGIYDIAVLFDPAKDPVATGWKPFAPQAGWNGKVLYSFGASSGVPRRQFRSEQNWNDDNALSRGFLVAINSMTDSLFNANRVSMSETVMMMKEKIVDSFGEIRYTIGNGCSGGSINQLTTASIFPGLLDGIQPTCTYPDSETTGIEVADCALLVHFYQSPEWQALTAGLTQAEINAKKAAINGHVDQTGCHAWVNTFSNLGRPGMYVPVFVVNNVTGATAPVGTPTNNCQLPAALIYDPVTNPTGARCTTSDHAVAIFGKVPGTSRARQIADNVGVQYGLKALRSGAITAEEFVTLNEKIGGVDFDDNFAAARTEADREALEIAYRAGVVSDGSHLGKTAIVDFRGYDDSNITLPGALGIHHVWRSFALRARLDGANGNHTNHVLWRFGTGLVPPASQLLQSFLTIDQWVGAIKADTSDASIEHKIARHRPASAFDFCFLSTDPALTTKITDSAVCDADPFLKPHASPRQTAGGPVAENIMKCQLRHIERSDYAPAVLTEAQLARLHAVFPGGVCDFSRRGVGQQAAVSPLDFSAGPGGVQLPPAPRSRARDDDRDHDGHDHDGHDRDDDRDHGRHY